jgi:hypothetical protein
VLHSGRLLESPVEQSKRNFENDSHLKLSKNDFSFQQNFHFSLKLFSSVLGTDYKGQYFTSFCGSNSALNRCKLVRWSL